MSSAAVAIAASFATEIENASSGSTPFSPPTREWMLIWAGRVNGAAGMPVLATSPVAQAPSLWEEAPKPAGGGPAGVGG